MKINFSYYFIILFLIYSCTHENKKAVSPNSKKSKTKKEQKEKPDLGEIKNGTYSNNYFEFSLEIDSSWTIQSPETVKKRALSKSERIPFESAYQKIKYEEMLNQSIPLLRLTKGKNNELIILAESQEDYQNLGIYNSSAYIKQLKKNLGQSQVVMEGEKKPSKTFVQPYYFHSIETIIEIKDHLIHQSYFVVFIKDYILSFILIADNDRSRLDFKKMVQEIQFHTDQPKYPGL